MLQATTEEYRTALEACADSWVPACGGKEQPFTVRGRRLLYCFNPGEQRHAYVDLDTDLALDEVEALAVVVGLRGVC